MYKEVSVMDTLDIKVSMFNKTESPFSPVGTDRILSDLEESRDQISKGQGLDMTSALDELGKKHGFI